MSLVTPSSPESASPSGRSRRALLAGGTEGNERLTVVVGLMLIVLVAVLGVTIVRIGQLLWLHLFLGFVLIGPVALKLGSTGYRFFRYYTHAPAYRRKGPPPPAMRGLAPVVVGLTVAVWGTGVVLLFLGPSSRGPLVLIHKVSFIAWLALTAVHVLGHGPEILRVLGQAGQTRRELAEVRARHEGDTAAAAAVPGAAGRRLSLAGAVLAGLLLAAVLIPEFGAWTHHATFHHH